MADTRLIERWLPTTTTAPVVDSTIAPVDFQGSFGGMDMTTKMLLELHG